MSGEEEKNKAVLGPRWLWLELAGAISVLCCFLEPSFDLTFSPFRAPAKLYGNTNSLDIPTLRPVLRELVFCKKTCKSGKEGTKFSGRNSVRVETIVSPCRARVQKAFSSVAVHKGKQSQSSARKQPFLV